MSFQDAAGDQKNTDSASNEVEHGSIQKAPGDMMRYVGMPRERSSTPKLASILMHLVDLMCAIHLFSSFVQMFLCPAIPWQVDLAFAPRPWKASTWEDSLRWKLNFNCSFRECTKKYRGKEQKYIGVNGKQSITK